MTPREYSIQSLWRSVLRDIPKRRASFFISGAIAPLVLWFLVAMLVHFQIEEIKLAAIPIVLLLPLGLVAAFSLRTARSHRFRDGRLQRWTALVHSLFYGAFLLTLSTYFLRVAIESGARYSSLPFFVYPGLLVLYGLTMVASAIWGPSSLPRSQADDDLAASRGVRWLPWVMGCQGSLIGLGVFLGAWLLHDDVPWGVLLVIGTSSLAAIVGLGVSTLGIYRFFILALHPIPEELQEEFGLRS